MVQVSVNGLLATGMTFVIIAGGIDLAVGSVLALSGMVFANYALSTTILPIGVAVMIGVLVGAATGVASGIMVAFFRMPAFVANAAAPTYGACRSEARLSRSSKARLTRVSSPTL